MQTSKDSSGNEITDLEEDWQNGQWTNSWLYTMTYDASGNELTELEKLGFWHRIPLKISA